MNLIPFKIGIWCHHCGRTFSSSPSVTSPSQFADVSAQMIVMARMQGWVFSGPNVYCSSVCSDNAPMARG